MRTFAGLATALASAGFAIGLKAPGLVALRGWAGGVILFVLAFLLLAAYKRGNPLEPAAHCELRMRQGITGLE
jgi:hypothetical protein